MSIENKVISHFDLDDAAFESKFASCAFGQNQFTHEAHLRLAWIHINKYGVDTAIQNIRKQIRSFLKSLKSEKLYNETVTIAGVQAVHHFMSKSNDQNFNDFISNHPQLVNNFKELLLSHYKTNIFESELAKSNYIPPEIKSF